MLISRLVAQARISERRQEQAGEDREPETVLHGEDSRKWSGSQLGAVAIKVRRRMGPAGIKKA